MNGKLVVVSCAGTRGDLQGGATNRVNREKWERTIENGSEMALGGSAVGCKSVIWI